MVMCGFVWSWWQLASLLSGLLGLSPPLPCLSISKRRWWWCVPWSRTACAAGFLHRSCGVQASRWSLLALCCLIPTWLGDRLLVCFPQPPSPAILHSILLSDYIWTLYQRPQAGQKYLTSSRWCVVSKCTAGPPRATNCQTGDVASSTLPTGHHRARAVVG